MKSKKSLLVAGLAGIENEMESHIKTSRTKEKDICLGTGLL